MTDGTTAPIVYVDANPFIYFVDGDEQAANKVRPFFALFAQKPGVATTSELTMAEVLAKASPQSRRNYLNLIVWSKAFRLQPVTRDVLIETADYRQASRKINKSGKEVIVKLPDAIHVVTAIRSRCRMFLSADESLNLPTGMMIVKPNEFGLSELRRSLQ
jgi:predicted nucleic acid-binding protein